MSHDSPYKQNRIETHLARQRGAGVRNLTTSFGFTFVLQPTTIERQKHEEPPTKRRKSTHPCGEKAVPEPVAQAEHDALSKPKGHTPTRRTATKRKQPRSFELPSDNDKLEHIAARSPVEQHDSFVVIKKPAAQRGRPKKTQSVTPDDDAEKPTMEVQEVRAATGKKRGRPKKDSSIVENFKITSITESEDAIKQPIRPIKKRGRPPKALNARKTEPLAEPIPSAPEPTRPANLDLEALEHGDEVGLEIPAKPLAAMEQFKPSTKKRGRPRKAQVQGTEPHSEDEPSLGSVMGVDGTERVSKAKDAEPTRRPRRQAAAAAMSKVSEGFIEEEESIDKKRRDPDLAPRRGRKKLTAPSSSNDSSSSGYQEDIGPPAYIKDHANGSSAESLDAVVICADELPSRPLGPVALKERPSRRTKSRPIVLPDLEENEAEILPDNGAERRPDITKRVPLSETQINIAIQTPSPEKPAKGIKAARKKTRTRPVDVEHIPRTTRGTQDAQAVVELPTVAKPRIKTTKKEPRREESTSRKPGCYPEASAAADQRLRDGRQRTKPAPAATSGLINEDVAVMPRKRRHAPQQNEPAVSAALLSEPTSNPATSCRINATTDDNNKVDWLFEESTTWKPSAAKKKPVSKHRALKDEEANMAEMDLDDLLSNIASFVPKNMRT